MARASGAAAPASPARYAPISSTGMRPSPEASVLAAARLMSCLHVCNANGSVFSTPPTNRNSPHRIAFLKQSLEHAVQCGPCTVEIGEDDDADAVPGPECHP